MTREEIDAINRRLGTIGQNKPPAQETRSPRGNPHAVSSPAQTYEMTSDDEHEVQRAAAETERKR
eukprot:2187726-Pyramimonas_sp.AAC.1